MKSKLRILEISIPHASVEGTLKAAMNLPKQLADAGFNVVFVLPWMQIDRSRSASPYAVSDYFALNNAIGNMDDARQWILECQSAGLRVVLDMPLNHTSPSNSWTSYDQWYVTDENGVKRCPQGTNWKDVFQLNHSNELVANACSEVLHFWLKLGVDGYRFDAAAFITDEVMKGWITSLLRVSKRELLLWCDSEAYKQSRPWFNGFFYHEAIGAARKSLSDWEKLVDHHSDDAIFYLTNHDTLHAGKCPKDEWPGEYQQMRKLLESSPNHFLLSWCDWKKPSETYSFMLEK
jgi:glycosidase